MLEYKILETTVKNAETEINYLALDGWRVVATCTISGSLTVGSTPMIVTLERERVL